MNRKTKMGYNAEAKWLIWQKLILCDCYTHTVVTLDYIGIAKKTI